MKNKLVLDYKVTNTNDSKAMGGMLRRAQVILNTNNFTALYDKGYHTGSELKTAIEHGIEVMVAIPDVPSASMAPMRLTMFPNLYTMHIHTVILVHNNTV
ncbi:MAG: hypothetical protein HS118_05340 [Bacteroidia bacterium]|nr:hypothetical protein [Bacteroidia bacterium]